MQSCEQDIVESKYHSTNIYETISRYPQTTDYFGITTTPISLHLYLQIPSIPLIGNPLVHKLMQDITNTNQNMIDPNTPHILSLFQ